MKLQVGKYIRTPEIKEKGRQSLLGHRVSERSKKKMSKTRKRLGIAPPVHRGENHPNWKGGISPINTRIRASKEYKLWRTAVFQRDNYICVFCGSRNGRGKKITLNADHIKPFSLFPELRFAIDNGRTLCVSCHKKITIYHVPSKHNTNPE